VLLEALLLLHGEAGYRPTEFAQAQLSGYSNDNPSKLSLTLAPGRGKAQVGPTALHLKASKVLW